MERGHGQNKQRKGKLMSSSGYIEMLRSSLEKKLSILDRIIAENERQLDVLRDSNALPEDLEATIDKKADYIDEIDALDDGFELLFERVKKELDANRQAYAPEISKMQTLIRQITDRSAQIESQEQRNREVAGDKFTYIKTQVKKVSKSQKAVNTYYRNMMKASYYDPQFMDNKK